LLQVGGALGLAVLATLSTTRTDDLLASGHATASALTSGYHLAFIVGAGFAVAAIGVAVAIRRPAAAAQEETEPAPESGELAYEEAA
jgi:hypothetical protein